jgi:hypothetical protein
MVERKPQGWKQGVFHSVWVAGTKKLLGKMPYLQMGLKVASVILRKFHLNFEVRQYLV